MGRNPFYDDIEITNGAGTFFDDGRFYLVHDSRVI
jgi:hypothetical protein